MGADLGTLRSLAEIAIVFAGFSALAGVVGDRPKVTNRHNLVREARRTSAAAAR